MYKDFFLESAMRMSLAGGLGCVHHSSKTKLQMYFWKFMAEWTKHLLDEVGTDVEHIPHHG